MDGFECLNGSHSPIVEYARYLKLCFEIEWNGKISHFLYFMSEKQ